MTFIVGSRQDMHDLATRLADVDYTPHPSDLECFSPVIRESLYAIHEGFPIDRARAELDGLYDEWESEGFPVEDHNPDDDWTEGDPDAFPDPEHAP